MCENVEKNEQFLKFVLDQYKTQEICQKAIKKFSRMLGFFLTNMRPKTCMR